MDMDATFLKEAVNLGAASADLKAPLGVRPYFITPVDYKINTVPDEALAEPFRLRQTVSVFDPKSFSDYFTDYCNQDSRIFVDLQAPAILGVLDYHRQIPKEPSGRTPVPDWTAHRLQYCFRPTKEWSAWSTHNRKPMKQIEFARFVEENLIDIVHPAHADMLEISRTMEAKKNVNFSSGVRLHNGEVQLTYQEEIRGTTSSGTMEIPEIFKIKIAPFEGTDQAIIDCRFRYEIKENDLSLRYEMVRPHKVIEAAVQRVVDAIRGLVTNPITFGSLS